MKIAMYGNVCNIHYALAKSLRANEIADAHLYLNPTLDIQNLPESDDQELRNNYPDWIHMDSRWDQYKVLKFDKTFIQELNKYDVVFLSDLGVLLAPYIKAKTIFFVTGGDLTRIPFRRRYMQELSGLKIFFVREYISFMQRRGIRKCDMIITQPFFPFKSALEQIGVKKEKVSSSYYPLLIDTAKIRYSPNSKNEIGETYKKQLEAFQFIIFHPSRLFIEKKNHYLEMGLWKGNDNLFKGFSIFLKKHNVLDACLVMPDRIHSPDIKLAKKIINDLGIEKHVVWLTPQNPAGFPRHELINFYSLSDVIADEFGTGWFGAVVVEGAACNKPTFCYVNGDIMKQLYPWHPIISVKEPEDIAEQIARFYFDKKLAAEQGELSRKWAVQFHSIEEGSKIYIDNLKKDIAEVFQKK